MKYEDYVIRSILCNNTYGIKKVHELTTIEDLIFDFDRYAELKPLIAVGDVASIKLFNNRKAKASLDDSLTQYLSILSFSDQDQKKYLVMVYDSSALEQDPQLIEIIPQSPE